MSTITNNILIEKCKISSCNARNDTAGIRESDDYIESIGINKSKNILNKADLVIALFDNENFDEEDNEILKLTQDKLTIRVFNKSDLNNYSNDKLYISALNKDISKLKNEILKVLGISKENYDNPSLANERDIGLLISCQNELNKVIELSSTTSIDLLVEHIKSAYLKILSITGEDYDFDMAKEIFSRFCLGK